MHLPVGDLDEPDVLPHLVLAVELADHPRSLQALGKPGHRKSLLHSKHFYQHWYNLNWEFISCKTLFGANLNLTSLRELLWASSAGRRRRPGCAPLSPPRGWRSSREIGWRSETFNGIEKKLVPLIFFFALIILPSKKGIELQFHTFVFPYVTSFSASFWLLTMALQAVRSSRELWLGHVSRQIIL